MRMLDGWSAPVLLSALALGLILAGCVTERDEKHLIRSGAFEPFTVYTDDGRDPDDYAQDVILLFHGYGSAMPNDDFDAISDLFGETHTILGFNYDYTDVEADKAALDELFSRHLKGRRVIALGTSLGGFWADYVAEHYPVAGAILINPALDPGSVLRKSLGTHKGDRRQAPYTVTEADAAAYDELRWHAEKGERHRLVLVADDDQVINPAEADCRFERTPRTTVTHFAVGGHNLPLDRPDVVAALRDFIARVAPGVKTLGHHSPEGRTDPLAPFQVSQTLPSLRPGLAVDYYYGKMNKIDVLRGLIRSRAGEPGAPVVALNYVGNEGLVLTSKASDMVGARLQGFLKVTNPGTHYLRVTSNDGVEVWISGRQFFSDPEVHRDRSSPILGADFPDPGFYPIEILYFEKKGTATLKLEWREPGTGKLAVIPANAYFHSPPE